MKKILTITVPSWYAIVLLLLVSLAVRLVFAIKTPVVGDAYLSQLIGSRILDGMSLNQFYSGGWFNLPYNNPPGLLIIIAAQVWLTRNLQIPYQIASKLPAIIADCAIIYLLYSVYARTNPKRGLLAGLLFGLNPVSILITSSHGQQDPVPILMILIALITLPKNVLLSAVFLGLGMLVKPFPILVLPLFLILYPLGRSQRIQFVFVSLVPLFFALLPMWLQAFGGVNQGLFSYVGRPDYGLLAIVRTWYGIYKNVIYIPVPNIDAMLTLNKVLFLLVYALFIINLSRSTIGRSLTKAISIVFLLFYFLYAGISSQYLVWVLPFLILYKKSYAIFYSVIATVALLGYYGFRFLIFMTSKEFIQTTILLAPIKLTANTPFSMQLKIMMVVYGITSIIFWCSIGFMLWRLVKGTKER